MHALHEKIYSLPELTLRTAQKQVATIIHYTIFLFSRRGFFLSFFTYDN